MPQRRKLHDHFFKQAKEDGYLARSAYKLKEIQERRKIIPRGAAVLDLGCAPGSWLQVAAEIIGPKGLVVGIDLQPVEVAIGSNVVALQGDIFKTPPGELLRPLQGTGATRFAVVLSDMAPNTTGAGDHFRSMDLCRRVLSIVPGLLAPRGNLAMKVFEGELYPELLRETGALFDQVKGFKPKATRDVSREMYIIAEGFTAACQILDGPKESAT